ncbi:SUN family beta-glucosidase [Microdochium nivale]|nr:SUN family beta-glucosidase [Microdochium nivale]
MKSSIAALSLAAGLVAAQPHQHHGHQHLHKRAGTPVVVERDYVTDVVPATSTAYVLGNGEVVTPDEAKKGIDNGLYVVVGESTPTFTPPPPPPAPTTTSSAEMQAMFIEAVTSAPPAPVSSAPAVESYPVSGGGIDSPFPSGKVPCSSFPSDYGADPISWMGLNGWSGIQNVPNYKIGDAAISFIETAIAGMGCRGGSYCSYSCPPGYVKTQWPESQGNTGQSIGGLWCNNQGFLELSRPEYKTLCMKGVGGITVVSKLSKNVALCRTDYPGTENMVCPTDVQPGSKVDLANVDTSDYYIWQNKKTTLQYYANQQGVSVEDGCRWDCAKNHDECGNWAPMIIGTGRTAGITYLSIFQNLPMSTAKLNYNVRMSGDVTIKCAVTNGVYSGSGDPTGCTTGVGPKGAIIEFY